MNKFEEKIVKINEELEAKLFPLKLESERLHAMNKQFRDLREANHKRVMEIDQERRRLIDEAKQQKAKVMEGSKDYYCINMSAQTLRKLLKGFMDENQETYLRWTNYVENNFPKQEPATEEGGSDE